MPLIVASPHSGRNYTDRFIASARLTLTALRRSEDSFVDELFVSAPRHGATLIAATFPRAFCDVNREAWELDPSMYSEKLPSWCNTTSARVLSGFGTIARLVSSGEPIYGSKLLFSDARMRIRSCWQPYHAMLEDLIETVLSRDPVCFLLDCHSMPSSSGPRSSRLPDIVLGDAHGSSCLPVFTEAVERFFKQEGLHVGRNDPYAGGYVTRHYGRPRERVNALQLEINRGLYMDERSLQKKPEFGAVEAMLERLIACLTAILRTTRKTDGRPAAKP